MRIKFNSRGFTLIEVAIVLIIISLVMAGLVGSLGAQTDIRDYAETRSELSAYKEAMVGYALSQTPPYLPCPDTVGGDGIEELRDGVTGACPNDVGDVPWATLGLSKTDSWNNTYLYRVTPAFSNNNGFALGSLGDNIIFNATPTVAATKIAENVPFVLISKGKTGIGAGNDEAENDLTNANFISHEQIDLAANAFDDVVVWVPATILFNRLVMAGKLP